MASLTIKTGFTIHIGHPSTNEYGRCDVEVYGINTEVDLDAQMAAVSECFDKAWPILKDKLDVQASEVLGVRIVRAADVPK